MQQLQSVLAAISSVEDQLARNKANDPAELKRIQQASIDLKAGADRWTDNVWAIKSYLVKKKGMSGKEVDKMLAIDGNFDYLT